MPGSSVNVGGRTGVPTLFALRAPLPLQVLLLSSIVLVLVLVIAIVILIPHPTRNPRLCRLDHVKSDYDYDYNEVGMRFWLGPRQTSAS
jgi:hypothetical protein